MPRMKHRILQTFALVCALAIHAQADVVVTKDGRRIEGKITLDSADKVRIATGAGEIEVARKDVASIERGLTKLEELKEREKSAKSAEEHFQLGRWADEQKMRTQAKRLMLRAVELDAQHEGANTWLGRVSYKGRWMTPEERDKARATDEASEMAAKGLVRWQDKWVTPDEKAHLEKGEVLVDGKWISFEDAQRRNGLELFEAKWLPRAEAFARNDAQAVRKLANVPMNVHLGEDALVSGPVDAEQFEAMRDGLARGRAWFDAQFAAPAGLALFGGRYAEFYVFEDDAAYHATIPHFASLTTTLPEGWAPRVKNTFGFLWWDPYPLSSARLWKRAPADLVGHCYHHWGHLLLNRHGYDGRLLPPWFDEGVASLLEFRTHERNAVFCKGSRKDRPEPEGPTTGGPKRDSGTKAGKVPPVRKDVPAFDPNAMRDGAWLAALRAGLKDVPSFDRLASLQFDELEGPDIAASMGIVEWLESKNGLAKFHAKLRELAPKPPARVLTETWERERCYDAAFKDAAGIGWREADQAWRAWIGSR